MSPLSIPQRKTLAKEQRSRSSYTASSAFKWLPLLKELEQHAEAGGKAFCAASEAKRSPTTLYIVLNDALRFLIDFGDTENKAWATSFRERHALRKELDGVWCISKGDKEDDPLPKVQGAELKEEDVVVDVRRKILQWYERANDMEIGEWHEVLVTDDLKAFILNLVAQSNTSEVQFEGRTIRIMK